MPADGLYYDNEFDRHIKTAAFNVRFARSYGHEVSMNAILTAMYTDMSSVESFNTLYLIFHGGRSRTEDSSQQMSYYIEGTSIHIGNGRLTSGNVQLLSPFRGHVRQIFLFSCSIASSQGSAFRPVGEPSGFDFCSSIARVTGAHVYASADVQFISQVQRHQFNGRVYLFNPDGTNQMQQDIPPVRD